MVSKPKKPPHINTGAFDDFGVSVKQAEAALARFAKAINTENRKPRRSGLGSLESLNEERAMFGLPLWKAHPDDTPRHHGPPPGQVNSRCTDLKTRDLLPGIINTETPRRSKSKDRHGFGQKKRPPNIDHSNWR